LSSLLLRGINFTDLALLTKKNLKHGRIVYKRAKTHKMYSAKLLPLTEKIIYNYMDDDRETLLPILSNQDLKSISKLPKRIGQQRKNTNKWLKYLGNQLQLSEKCTGYLFRYSHASACKKLGYSKELISHSLGHSFGVQVTNCYLEDYDLDIIDEMNATVCNRVIRGV
jgi:site-specific recombinase XerD